METEITKLTKEQLEHYRNTNPKYYSDMLKFYYENDPDYYKSVVQPYLTDLKNRKKKKNRIIIITIFSVFILLLIIGIIGSQDPDYQKELEVERQEKELKSKEEELKKKEAEKEKIKADIEDRQQEESVNKEEEQNEETIENKQPKIKDEVHVGNFAYMVSEIKFTKTIGNNYTRKKADGIYLLINLQIINTSKESRTLDNNMFKLIDDTETTYETSAELTTTLEMSGMETLFLKKCQPNIQTQGILIYEVPGKNKVYSLKVSGGFWSGKTALIRLE